ncbi:hypothetical protein BO71DRAFT_150902 [Aspergillus ellipticus CBS 707.79]|uniref:Uncharacterized protein n=1 Tax=Aspergillus ellipticus CBS 707.79 TaxID=1448320 RepID=A0A319D0G1_9EURO|nr:hypothetical protein BO71DRAFT_150902 [Aspergillus ellipticus CBS 707.79]
MASLQTLPPELLLHILGFVANVELAPNDDGLSGLDNLPQEKERERERERDKTKARADEPQVDLYAVRSSEGQADLAHLCLVCRQLRDLAQPLLYQEFDHCELVDDLSRIVAFVRTLTLCPSLGHHVRSVSALPLPGGPAPDDEELALSADDHALFSRTIRGLGLAPEETLAWLTALHRVDYSVFMALLLLRTPNLRSLDVCGGEFFPNPVRHLFRRKPDLLQNLQFLWIDGKDVFEDYPLAAYDEFLRLPNLKAIDAEYGHLIAAQVPPAWTPQSLALERIHLRLGHMDVGAMRALVRACRTLTDFRYCSFSVDPDEQMVSLRATPEFDAAQLYQALLPHKQTLRRLQVAFTLDFAARVHNPDPLAAQASCPKIGSLLDFPILANLAIQYALLPARPEFPPSLETLIVEDCNVPIRDLTEQIATACHQGRLPALRRVQMLALDIADSIRPPEGPLPPCEDEEEHVQRLRDLFKGTGVEFDVLPFPGSDGNPRSDVEYDHYVDYGEDDMDEDDTDDEDEYEYQFPPAGGAQNFSQQLLEAVLMHGMHGGPMDLDLDGGSEQSWVTEDEDEEEEEEEEGEEM